MNKATRLTVLVALVAGGFTLANGPATAAAPSQRPLAHTCTGGEIESGTYASVTVTGMCSVAAGATVDVVGNIHVTAGAMLDAQSVPSTITVGRNVIGAAGSLVGLGCQPNPPGGSPSAHPCVDDPSGISDITIRGNISITNAHTVLLNGITVEGNVTLVGGGAEIPWAIKNNTIGGNLTVSGQTVEWLGVLFNTIDGNATLTNITVTETHPGAARAVFVVRNTIGRNLTCMGLGPEISGGFVPGSVNVVGRNANGQCAALV